MPVRRRGSLTPLESELRSTTDRLAPAPPGPTARTRRRLSRHRHPPTTLFGALVHGIVRLTVAVAVASGVALLVDHWLHRSTAVGFYLVGAALLTVAFSTTSGMSGRIGGWYFYHGAEGRERRFNLGIAYIAAGIVVIAIAIAIEGVA